ncbi:asparagine synthase (glutamine-hydrolysing) [Azospirillaceae bacterium]
MCGMCGVVDISGGDLNSGIEAMTATLTHRCPDGTGVWTDEAAGVAPGHRRLAIFDLSPSGHQPLVSHEGRCVITFSGARYNFQDIRRELVLSGAFFRGHSDTEVMLESFSFWGVSATVRRLVGIFAIALWDREERTLTLIRDQIGVKPVYWRRFGTLLLFGSELKALRARSGCVAVLDRDSASGFLRRSYVPGPGTIDRGIFKQPPETAMTFSQGCEPIIDCYWDLRSVVTSGRISRETSSLSPEEIVDQLEALLRDAIGRQMVSDVPLGAFFVWGD